MRDNLRYKFDPRPLVNNLGGPIKSDFQMRVEGSRGEIGLLIWEPGLQVAPKTVIAVFVKSNLPSNSSLRDMEISPSSRINLVYWDVVGRRGPSLGYVKALKMARSGIDNSTVDEFGLSHLLSYLCCLIKRKERRGDRKFVGCGIVYTHTFCGMLKNYICMNLLGKNPWFIVRINWKGIHTREIY